VASYPCRESVGNGENKGAAISSSNLIRLGGLAPIAGGVVFAVYSSLVGLSEDTLFGGTLRVLFILFLLSMLVVIAALHLLLQRQGPRYGLAGTIVSATAFVGVALIAGGYIIGIDGLGATLFLLGVSAATLGIIGLAPVTLSLGVLPWWGGAALIAGNPLLAALIILIFIGSYPHFGGWLVAVPWIVVGFAVFQAAGRPTEQLPRVR
jgi:hypothetical protein